MQNIETLCKTMNRKTKDKTTGSKGFGQGEAQGLARCGLLARAAGRRGTAGTTSPSSSDCYRIGTWNVQSLYQPGKMANVMQEMIRMKLDIMGIAETFWDKEGEFTTSLPNNEENFRVLYSGGDKKRRGVRVILKGDIAKSVLQYEAISERLMIVRIKAAPVNVLLIQEYAPCEDEDDIEKERFYESLDQTIAEHKKGRECLIVMGDFNGKVGNSKEDIVGPFGVGIRNENGEHVVDFCRRHRLFITNTWYQQRKSAQHTWTSPDGRTKNQIDFIMIDNRFRNGIRN